MKKKYLILILMFLFGCDLLSTRDPEEPNTPRSDYLPATTPDILFSNIENSFKEKIIENYMASFVDPAFISIPFIFIPSAGATAVFPNLSDWNIDAERQYFNNLITATIPNVPIILSLENEIKNIFGDSAVYQFDYEISITTNDESIPEEYKGSLTFDIFLDSRNQWVISRWKDIKSSENPSWSELKGRFN